MKEIIDALGKPCPIPVIESRRAIEKISKDGGNIEILVDNDVARQNLEKMATGLGLPFAFEPIEDDNIRVTIGVPIGGSVMKTAPKKPRDFVNTGPFVVAIGAEEMGQGSDELGKNLMKAFVYSLTEIPETPDIILLYNGGVKLSTTGSAALRDLLELVKKGAIIKSCGACLNFYKLEKALAIGEVTNMFDILATMADASRLIQL